ncbi:hypothetical protein A0J61_10726 [Choanephora cucurbitarum]|uniref:Uncharacterized protein n=1 Tax=Choanephora cucurbitarum TaxID=101091 RepID=A0A1C7MWG3_9FUNG|nr:hypothetical protein A0J61_10726 [Choanephora cucurbitarum]
MSHFSNKIDSLLRGTRKTEDEVSEIKMHVEQLEARFEERVNQLFFMVQRSNEILKKLVVVEGYHFANLFDIKTSRQEMHGDLNTPLNRFKYFLISCFGDSINPDVSINSTDRAKKEAMMKLNLSTLEQLSKVVLADLLYQVQEKEPVLKVKTWTQIPLKYKLVAYDDLRYLGSVYHIPINRSRDNWLEEDLILYCFRNKKPDQLSSKSKRDKKSDSTKDKQFIEGVRAAVSEKNVHHHLSTITLNGNELDPDLAAIISHSAFVQQGDKRPLDNTEYQGSNKMSRTENTFRQ